MSVVSIPISDKNRELLDVLAKRAGISVESFLQQRVERLLEDAADEFQQASDYVLNKNKELYRRLA